MNKHKKLLSFVLVLVMVLGMFPLNVFATETTAAAEVCEYCKAELTENALHSTACPTNCTCDPKPAEGEAHLEGCKLYVSEGAATQNQADTTGSTETTGEPAKTEGPKAGDKIWIKPGVEIYKNAGDAQGHKTSLPYYIEIKSIETAGEQTWYQFAFTGISSGMALLLHEYDWAKAADTSTAEPEEPRQESSEPAQTTETTAPAESTEAAAPATPNACNCGETAPENLANHADSCPRKQYVKTLFEGKTAEALAADWNTFDAATQADILSMLEVYDKTTFDALNALLTKPQGIPDTEVKLGETKLKIQVPTGAFPAGTSIAVTPVYRQPRSLQSSLAYSIKKHMPDHNIDILSMEIVDITFTNNGEEVQPSEKVLLTFDIPASDISSNTDMIAVLHIDDFGEAELVAMEKVYNIQDMTIGVEVDSFSHYAILQNQTTYVPTLLRSKLEEDAYKRYQIVTFPVTLNDFDAKTFNDAYNNSGLQFTTGAAGAGMNLGALAATQGIVANDLTAAGFPKTYGTDRGQLLFGTGAATGKTPHANVDFEFIYDTATGYYTYNSGANHAQYNASTNRVELYTDTLAPFNYRKDITFSASDRATKTNDTGYTLFTVKTPSGSYMFNATNLELSYHTSSTQFKYHYGSLYMRLYSNHSGNIRAKVIYADNSSQTFTLPLQKDVWADYNFDGFEQKKVITELRIQLPDAKAGDYVRVATAGFLQTVNGGEVNFAGLYPFNTDITKTYAGSANYNVLQDEANWKTTWENRIQTGLNEELMSSRVIYNTPHTGPALTDSYAYFGMAMDVDFYIPESGKVNNQDIVFTFNGDDDMWVFVDGKLALDIGGAHTHVDGIINFTTGSTYIERVRSITDPGVYGAEYNGTLNASQFAPGYHKMKIFYMERAGTNSNCLIRFNMPVVPTGDVNVSKKVEVEGFDVNIAARSADFNFEIKVADTAWANKSYALIEGTTPVEGTFKTDNQGKFKLKHNQTAIFDGIDESKKVTVTEQNPAEEPGEFADAVYTGTTVNKKQGLSDELTTSAGGVSSFAFVNKYSQKGATIYYKVVGDVGGTVNPASESLMILTGDAAGSTATAAAGYEFVGWYQEESCQNQLGTAAKYDPTRPATGWVDGTTYWAKFEELTVPLHYVVVGPDGCGTVELKDESMGPAEQVDETVQVVTGEAIGANAAAGKNFKFVGWYDNAEGTGTPLSTEAGYTPNQPSTGRWVEDTFYALFEYAAADLTISKSGISDLDNHEGKDDFIKEETQSTVYIIEGTPYSGEPFESMEVTILGNGSVTLKDLPVGEYTVTEKGSWSWRYGTDDKIVDVTLSGGTTGVAEFKNQRTNILWLSGDNYKLNLFDQVKQ